MIELTIKYASLIHSKTIKYYIVPSILKWFVFFITRVKTTYYYIAQ
jgi:hypothetical protein